MHLGKELAEWHAAVSGKSVAHASTGADETDGGEDHAEQREHEETDATGAALGCVHEDLEQGAVGRVDDGVDVVDDKQEAREEDEAGDHSDGDTVDHDSGAFDMWLRDFFNHVNRCVEACGH